MFSQSSALWEEAVPLTAKRPDGPSSTFNLLQDSVLVHIVARHQKHLQQRGELESRSVLMGVRRICMGFGRCGIQGTSSLIGLSESWDFCRGEEEGLMGCLLPSLFIEEEKAQD